MSYQKNPSAVCQVIWNSSQPTVQAAPAKLIDANRLDIGDYEYLLLVVSNMGGTGGSIVVPYTSETRTGPEFPLDGTNGAPNYSTSFANSADSGTKSVVIHVRSLRYRYFNVAVTPSGGTFRPCVTLFGFGHRTTSVNRNIPANLAAVNLA